MNSQICGNLLQQWYKTNIVEYSLYISSLIRWLAQADMSIIWHSVHLNPGSSDAKVFALLFCFRSSALIKWCPRGIFSWMTTTGFGFLFYYKTFFCCIQICLLPKERDCFHPLPWLVESFPQVFAWGLKSRIKIILNINLNCWDKSDSDLEVI